MRDLLEVMLCKNCKYYKKGICSEKNINTQPDSTCANFEEKIDGELEYLAEAFFKINNVLIKYMDMPEENRVVVALWIIGTYLHKEFETFPYLFINAMRGSGKTRLLKIISALADKGQILASLKESTLFRTNGTLCIDEFEGVGKKDKNELRELLNAAYKKGVGVVRMKKVRKRVMNEFGKERMEENQEAEMFEPYRPIVMANIWGMEEVLGDRCIPLILEKSDNPLFTKLIEDFDKNPEFSGIKSILVSNQCSLCNVVTKKYLHICWNDYILKKYITTLNTHSHITTETTQTTTTDTFNTFFDKIDETGVDGRHLELLMPLFFISKEISDSVFEKVLEISKTITKERKEEELNESRDVMLFDFVTRKEEGIFYSITDMMVGFKEFIGEGVQHEDLWLNQKWIGKALKRLNLIVDKRRVSRGVEVILNIRKAREKLKIFRSPETKQ